MRQDGNRTPDKGAAHSENIGMQSHQLEAFAINGKSMLFSRDNFWDGIFTEWDLALVIGFATLMTAIDPNGVDKPTVSVALNFGFWVFVACVYDTFYMLFKHLILVFGPPLGIRRIYLPVTSTLVLLPILPVADYFGGLMDTTPVLSSSTGIREILIYLISEQFFLTCYVTITDNRNRKEQALRAHADGQGITLADVAGHDFAAIEQAAHSRSIFIGGQEFTAAELLYISAEGHHLRVVSFDGEKMVRAKLRDAYHALGTKDCFIVHRSYGVMRWAIERYQSEGKTMVLHLQGGTSVRVATAKKQLFLEWYKA
ncbi:MAG: LytTR family DNA-binding domain-containing protein, partial [Rhodobacteraceae bacterium]|nr:LytTR family DNA-binding domain-containing protein [Paracoccaceae bacterium]